MEAFEVKDTLGYTVSSKQCLILNAFFPSRMVWHDYLNYKNLQMTR